MAININDIAAGDVFSESSHYTVLRRTKDAVFFKQIETGQEVKLGNEYVKDLLKSADQVDKVIKVGKEDKFWTKKQIADELAKEAKGKPSEIKAADNVQEGELRQEGIRTIFENIHKDVAITVWFQKQDTKLTKKEYDLQLLAQRSAVADDLEKVATSKKGIKQAALVAIENIQRNFISDTVPGEVRKLRGYKLQFKSRDGKYACFDQDLEQSRPVNIVTLKAIVVEGVHYVLED